MILIKQIYINRPADGDTIMVDYSLQSTGNSDAKYLAGVLQPAIKSGKIGGVNLTSNDVYFVAISGMWTTLNEHWSSKKKLNVTSEYFMFLVTNMDVPAEKKD